MVSPWLLRLICLCWQKEEDGEILNSLGHPETTFEQSGLGPGQEYEVKLEVVKNNQRGPAASRSVVTSESTRSLFEELKSTTEKNQLSSGFKTGESGRGISEIHQSRFPSWLLISP